MIFDFKNNKAEALANGIVEKEYFSVIEPTMVVEGGVVSGHIFRNFDSLTFEEDVLIENCIFEDCGTIDFENDKVINCEFHKTGLVFTRYTEFDGCEFSHIVAEGGQVISLEEGLVRNCKFDDITLLNDSYVCDGVGKPWIERCTFGRISTSRRDGEIIFCENTEGKIFKRKKICNIIDEASCTGLELSPEHIVIVGALHKTK